MSNKAAWILGISLFLSVLLWCATHRFHRTPENFIIDTWTGKSGSGWW